MKLESSVSRAISRFDTMYDGPSYSKFTETARCLKVCMSQDTTTAIPQRRRKLEGVNLRMNGVVPSPTEAVLIPWTVLSSRTEAVSPTVSQLSAVFENTDSPSAVISEKAENNEYSVTGHYPLNLPSVTVTNLDTFGHLKDSSSWSPPSKHSGDAEDARKSTTSPGLEVASKSTSLASVPSEEARQARQPRTPHLTRRLRQN